MTDIAELHINHNSIWSYNKIQLTINSNHIRLKNKKLWSLETLCFDKHAIKGYRYGVNWLSGYQFTIGREYQIDVLNHRNEITKIRFKTYYGYQKLELHHHFNSILQELWNKYFYDISNCYLEKIYDGQSVEICGVQINLEHIIIHQKGIFKHEKKRIPWEKVKTRDYLTHYVIYSTEDAANINWSYNYLNDWNIGILFSVIETILRTKTANPREPKS